MNNEINGQEQIEQEQKETNQATAAVSQPKLDVEQQDGQVAATTECAQCDGNTLPSSLDVPLQAEQSANPKTGKARGISRATKEQMLRFFMVSCFTGLLALGSFALMSSVIGEFSSLKHEWTVTISETFSVIVSCVFSFVINSKFTFEDRKARRAGIFLYVLFYALITPLGSLLILWLNTFIPWLIVCKLIKMTINLVVDFAFCRFFLFKYLRKKFDV